MARYGVALNQVLVDFDRKMNSLLHNLSKSLLSCVDQEQNMSNNTSNTFIPQSSAMSNWDERERDNLVNQSYRAQSEQFA